MFKTKWQKKYEQAMETIEFWRQFHAKQIKEHSDDQYLVEIHSAQKIALADILTDMKKIAES